MKGGRWQFRDGYVYGIYGAVISPLSMIVFILYAIPPRSLARREPGDLAFGVPGNGGVGGAGFTQADRDPSALMDSQIKAGAQ